ncbi:MAG: hypothetical protein KY469_05965 [Actinobacteria bacterium]|nr:hypothetical protein [Actinomycetota bacterium]
MRTGVALIAALTAGAVLCGACSSGNAEPGSSPSPLTFGPPSFPATAYPTPDDPYAIPDTIDAAYIEKVYGALAEVQHEAKRELLGSFGEVEVLPSPVRDRLRAIYAVDAFTKIAAKWQADFQEPHPPDVPTPLRPVSLRVLEVHTATPTCIVALADYDFSGVSSAPPAVEPIQFIALVPATPDRDPEGFNPTPWIISYEVLEASGSPSEEAPCDAFS